MTITLRRLGLCDYQATWDAMRDFIARADDSTTEEIWLLQHPPVYTLGKNGKPEHLLNDNGIPLIRSDRGGQITYHAPGQLVVYLLLNIKARGIGLRRFICLLQTAVVNFLARYGIAAEGDISAPGVYVDGAKIAAIGLRLWHGWCYHGISLNISMDLAPFDNINPCGYPALPVTQLADLAPAPPPTLDALQTLFGQTLSDTINHG